MGRRSSLVPFTINEVPFDLCLRRPQNFRKKKTQTRKESKLYCQASTVLDSESLKCQFAVYRKTNTATEATFDVPYRPAGHRIVHLA
jgi:hypothetical protein